MSKQLHLLVCISGHGYGHVAQTAPVLNALRERLPELQLTIRSEVAFDHLRSRINGPFDYMRELHDIGMLMSSALDVRVEESARAYHAMHREWGMSVMNEAQMLRAMAPDFVLSNVGYLPLAGAHHVGIPCAAMSSLNWGDIHAHYCGSISGAHQVTEQIRRSYANAGAFLRLTPGMNMPHLPNLVPIGPVAKIGRHRREEIDRLLGLGTGEKLVLVSLGGIASRLPMECWPRLPGVRWLVQANWHVAHPDALMLDSLEMDFTDVLASCDALVCKPGYGSFAEAACNGVPVLYVSRHDWPEERCLTTWLTEHGRCVEVTRQQLEDGVLAEALAELWSGARPTPVSPTGIAEAADYLLRSISIASP